MNVRSGESRTRTAKGKAAVVSNSSKTLRKQKQAKPTVKLSFKSPLVSRTNIDQCDADLTKLILDRVSGVFRNRSPSNDNYHLKTSIIIGINAVTKAMESEQKNLRLLLICKEVTPAILTEHLPIMAYLRHIPCIIISCSSKRLGQCLGVPMATCFAITENGTSDHSPLQQCIQTLARYAEIPTIPWLRSSALKYQAPELDENHPKRGHNS